MTESNDSGNINLSFSMSTSKLKLAGVLLVIITGVITLVVALIFGISGSNQASKNEVSIATTLAAFNSAQSDTTAARSKVDAMLDSLGGIQNNLKGSLETTESLLTTTNESLAQTKEGLAQTKEGLAQTKEGLAQTKEDVTAQTSSINDVESSLAAVSDTFRQTRDIANANKRQLADNDTLNKYLFVEAAFNLFGKRQDTSLATLGQWEDFMATAVSTTGDTELITSWNAVQRAWNQYVSPSTGADQYFYPYDPDDEWLFLLAQSDFL